MSSPLPVVLSNIKWFERKVRANSSLPFKQAISNQSLLLEIEKGKGRDGEGKGIVHFFNVEQVKKLSHESKQFQVYAQQFLLLLQSGYTIKH